MSPQAAFVVDPDLGLAPTRVEMLSAVGQTSVDLNPGEIEQKRVVQAASATLARAEASMQTDEPFESTHLVDNFA